MPVDDPRAAGRTKRLLLVLAGLALLGLLGGGLLWLFLRDGADKGGGGDPDLVLPKETPKPLIELSADEEKLVQSLVSKGTGWLKKQQEPDGTWPPYKGHGRSWTDGVTALAGLTLLSSGVDPRDISIQKAAEHLRKAGPKVEFTYELALAILFLDKLGDRRDDALIETWGLRLAAGQNRFGGWNYGCPVLPPEEATQLRQALDQVKKQSFPLLQGRLTEAQTQALQELLKELPHELQVIGAFQDPPTEDVIWDLNDNSNTQFALLALWTARRRGLPVDRPLELSVMRFQKTQLEEGNWLYDWSTGGSRSMACAGLLGLAVRFGVTKRDTTARAAASPSIKKALDFIATHLTVPEDPNQKTELPELYFLWSVERVGALYHLPAIGGKDWYRWGLRILNDHQLTDGRWSQKDALSTDVVDTCFALLFLSRVNLTQDLTERLQ